MQKGQGAQAGMPVPLGLTMELYIFGRFLVLDGKESAFEAALGDVVMATRAEVGCVEVHGYRSVRNARLFYLHSRWKDVEAFELHAKLPHTEKFLERVEKLLAEARDVKRCERIV
jgi:quinol monooxygenase YgiN